MEVGCDCSSVGGSAAAAAAAARFFLGWGSSTTTSSSSTTTSGNNANCNGSDGDKQYKNGNNNNNSSNHLSSAPSLPADQKRQNFSRAFYDGAFHLPCTVLYGSVMSCNWCIPINQPCIGMNIACWQALDMAYDGYVRAMVGMHAPDVADPVCIGQ